MTDKKKEKTRALSRKSGMSYQAAHNVVTNNEKNPLERKRDVFQKAFSKALTQMERCWEADSTKEAPIQFIFDLRVILQDGTDIRCKPAGVLDARITKVVESRRLDYLRDSSGNVFEMIPIEGSGEAHVSFHTTQGKDVTIQVPHESLDSLLEADWLELRVFTEEELQNLFTVWKEMKTLVKQQGSPKLLVGVKERSKKTWWVPVVLASKVPGFLEWYRDLPEE